MGQTFQRALLIVAAGGLLGLGVNAVSPRRIPWRRPPRWTPAATDLVTLEDARRLWERGEAVFLDARATEQYRAGHVAGAWSLPLQEFETVFPSLRSRLSPDQALVLYCDGERCDDSYRLLLKLRPLGYTNARVLVNGWTLWRRAQLPSVQGGSP